MVPPSGFSPSRIRRKPAACSNVFGRIVDRAQRYRATRDPGSQEEGFLFRSALTMSSIAPRVSDRVEAEAVRDAVRVRVWLTGAVPFARFWALEINGGCLAVFREEEPLGIYWAAASPREASTGRHEVPVFHRHRRFAGSIPARRSIACAAGPFSNQIRQTTCERSPRRRSAYTRRLYVNLMKKTCRWRFQPASISSILPLLLKRTGFASRSL